MTSEKLYSGEDNTEKYRTYRPNYPKELFQHIIDYYFHGQNTNEKIPLAIDVACGSGQATADLSLYCDRVIGIDVSEDQLAQAIQRDNIEYRCNKGEDLSFLQSNSVDLLTIATALHWVDLNPFLDNVKRILKPHTGVFAIWVYGFGRLNNHDANAIIDEFVHVLLSSYWNERQALVETFYESILPLFPYQSTLCQYVIERQIETTVEGFLGFIQTKSICQTFRKENSEEVYEKILEDLRKKLMKCYLSKEDHGTMDDHSIKVTISSPIRLYLMRKDEI